MQPENTANPNKKIVLQAGHKLSKSQVIATVALGIPIQNDLLETKDGYFLHDGLTLISTSFPYVKIFQFLLSF